MVTVAPVLLLIGALSSRNDCHAVIRSRTLLTPKRNHAAYAEVRDTDRQIDSCCHTESTIYVRDRGAFEARRAFGKEVHLVMFEPVDWSPDGRWLLLRATEMPCEGDQPEERVILWDQRDQHFIHPDLELIRAQQHPPADCVLSYTGLGFTSESDVVIESSPSPECGKQPLRQRSGDRK